MMMPMVKTGREVTQILTDMRQNKFLPWADAVVIVEQYHGSMSATYLKMVQ